MSIGSCKIFIVLNRTEASYSWPRKNLHSYHQRTSAVTTLVIYGLRPPDEVLIQWFDPARRHTSVKPDLLSKCLRTQIVGCIPLFLLNA
jgi:hypothetical protein